MEGQESLLTETDDHNLPPSCFVSCPVGDEHADFGAPDREVWEKSIEVFEQVIEPACSAFGLRPIRADQIARTGEITEQVFTRLRDDDVVIADLTDGNSNVMYELGLRHTTRKLTVQLGERGHLPFDVAAIRTIMFVRTQGGLIQARKRLTDALSSGLAAGGDYVTATRVWLKQSVWPESGESAEEDSDEPGFLEKLVDVEGHIGRLPELLGEVTGVMHQMTVITQEIGAKIERANEMRAPASARLHLTDQVAAALEPHAARIEEISTAYELAVEKVDPGVRHILGVPRNGPESGELQSFRETVSAALHAAEKYVASTTSLRDQLKAAGDATRSMRRVSGRIRTGLSRLITATDRLVQWRVLLD